MFEFLGDFGDGLAGEALPLDIDHIELLFEGAAIQLRRLKVLFVGGVSILLVASVLDCGVLAGAGILLHSTDKLL